MISEAKTFVEGASAIVGAAAAAVSHTVEYAGALSESASLSQHVKKSIIGSRTWVDATLVQDPVTSDILKHFQSLYVAYVLMALKLQNLTVGGKTISDSLAAVSTENWEDRIIDTAAKFSSVMGLENVNPPVQQGKGKQGQQEEKPKPDNIAFNDREVALDTRLPLGRIVEVEFQAGGGEKVKCDIMVRIAPYRVPQNVMELMLKSTVRTPFMMRLLQARVGDIRWVRDFVLQADRLKERQDALRNDPAGIVQQYLADIAKKTAQEHARAGKIADGATNQQKKAISQNIANTMMIVNMETVLRVKAATGLDLMVDNHRKLYMRDAFMMFIAVVDPTQMEVHFFIDGMEDAGIFGYEDLRVKKNVEPNDLVKALAAFTQGRVPRY